jgi:hypothetical protein
MPADGDLSSGATVYVVNEDDVYAIRLEQTSDTWSLV